MESKETMGAAASKKLRVSLPHSSRIAWAKAPSVKGPVAMTAGPSGMAVTSPTWTVILGWLLMCWVTRSENFSRSTAKAPPAETLVSSAQAMVREDSIRISSFRSPAADPRREAFRELEQTSSAKPGYLWAGLYRWGFISKRSTPIPLWAKAQAASQPARPAPTTAARIILPSPFSLCRWPAHNRSPA